MTYFFFYVSRKQVLTFHANCLQFAWNVKSGLSKKNIINFSSAEFAHSTESVKPPIVLMLTVSRHSLCCSSTKFVLSLVLFSVKYYILCCHLIKPLSGTLGGLCSMTVTFPGYLHIIYNRLNRFIYIPASILYKSIVGRYRPVSYPDGPITARYRVIKNDY